VKTVFIDMPLAICGVQINKLPKNERGNSVPEYGISKPTGFEMVSIFDRKKRRPAADCSAPAVSAQVTRSQGIGSHCSSSHHRRDCWSREGGRELRLPSTDSVAPPSVSPVLALRSDRVATDLSHCTPRRHIGVDRIRDGFLPALRSVITRIYDVPALVKTCSPENAPGT